MPEEIAAAAVWLCSEAAAFIIGHAIGRRRRPNGVARFVAKRDAVAVSATGLGITPGSSAGATPLLWVWGGLCPDAAHFRRVTQRFCGASDAHWHRPNGLSCLPRSLPPRYIRREFLLAEIRPEFDASNAGMLLSGMPRPAKCQKSRRVSTRRPRVDSRQSGSLKRRNPWPCRTSLLRSIFSQSRLCSHLKFQLGFINYKGVRNPEFQESAEIKRNFYQGW